MGRKKIQSECSEDNPLELLPEKRSKIPMKSHENSSTERGNEQVLFQAVNYLLTEVFYSDNQQSASIEEMKGASIIAKSLNMLFIPEMNNS